MELINDAFADAVVLRELLDIALVLLGQAEGGVSVILVVDVVRLGNLRRDAEAVLLLSLTSELFR